MKLMTTTVECRGCQKSAIIECEAPGWVGSRTVPFKCSRCGSRLAAEIRRKGFSKIETRVQMIEATKTLLNILHRRGRSAKNQSKK